MKKIKKLIFPMLLFLFPFWNVNQGLDFADTGYTLCNFAYYEKLDNTWKIATYLANEAGRFLRILPGGKTLLGLNLYTALLVSVMAVTAYFFLRKLVPPVCAFVGEALAIALCWCPTIILYNYLTYFLMLFMLLLLLHGIGKGGKLSFAAAGILLGVNVFIRFSNLAEAAFILLVWYGAWLTGKPGEKLRKAAGQTGWCLFGFAVGFGAVFASVCARFGFQAYGDMILGMSEIEGQASGYSVWDMLFSPIADYGTALQWIFFWGIYLAAGYGLFWIGRGRLETLKKAIFLLGFPVLYRFAWGHSLLPGSQTMYDMNYYSYNAVYVPVAMILLYTMGHAIYRLWKKDYNQIEKVQAFMVILIIVITPLGSNNKLHPIINNLFLVLPYTFAYTMALWKKWRFQTRSVTGVFLIFLIVQTAGFGLLFVFGDGSIQEKRDTRIKNNEILHGIYTTRAKAETVEELTAFYETISGMPSMITYGNLPGLSYYVGADMALGSAWPDLESYALRDFRTDMERVGRQIGMQMEKPVIAVSELLDEEEKRKEKYQILEQFMQEHGYEKQFTVQEVSVYY